MVCISKSAAPVLCGVWTIWIRSHGGLTVHMSDHLCQGRAREGRGGQCREGRGRQCRAGQGRTV